MAPSLSECTSSYFFVPFQRPRPAAAATASPRDRCASGENFGEAAPPWLSWPEICSFRTHIFCTSVRLGIFRQCPAVLKKVVTPKMAIMTYNDINGSSPLAIDPKSKRAERSVCNSDWLSPHVLLVLLTLKCGWYRHSIPSVSGMSVAKSSYFRFFFTVIYPCLSVIVFVPPFCSHWVKKSAISVGFMSFMLSCMGAMWEDWHGPCGNVKINSYQFKVHGCLLIPLLFGWSVRFIRHNSTSWLVLVFPR